MLIAFVLVGVLSAFSCTEDGTDTSYIRSTPSAPEYTVFDLDPGTYYFAVSTEAASLVHFW